MLRNTNKKLRFVLLWNKNNKIFSRKASENLIKKNLADEKLRKKFLARDTNEKLGKYSLPRKTNEKLRKQKSSKETRIKKKACKEWLLKSLKTIISQENQIKN